MNVTGSISHVNIKIFNHTPITIDFIKRHSVNTNDKTKSPKKHIVEKITSK